MCNINKKRDVFLSGSLSAAPAAGPPSRRAVPGPPGRTAGGRRLQKPEKKLAKNLRNFCENHLDVPDTIPNTFLRFLVFLKAR